MAGPMNWTYEPDYYPSGDGLFTTGGASNNNDYNNAEADKLIQESTSPASASITKRALFAYEAYLRKSNAVVFLPWVAGSYTALGFLLVHANNVADVHPHLGPAVPEPVDGELETGIKR